MSKIIILGAESTGTRITTKILEENGFNVVRRSLPWAQEWPDLDKSYRKHRFSFAIITVRAWPYMIKSQVRQKHTHSEIKAEKRTREGYKRIFRFLEKYNIPFVIFSYDALIASPDFIQNWILEYFGSNNKVKIEITNENKKYETN